MSEAANSERLRRRRPVDVERYVSRYVEPRNSEQIALEHL